MSLLDGPAPVPLLGWRANALRFLTDPIGYMDRLPAVRGVISFVKGGCPPVLLPGKGQSVFTLGAGCNRAVLGDTETFSSQRVPGPDGAFQHLTAGLFSMNGARHTQQRRLVQPAFHKRRVDGYRDTMVAHTARVLDRWTVGETRDVVPALQELTLSIASDTLFGIGDTGDLGLRILEIVSRAISPASMVPLDVWGTPRHTLARRAEAVEADLRALVERKRATGLDEPDVLATLIRTRDEDGGALTDDELIGQVFLLFFAGHDTTRNALAWTLFLLSQHPAVADALHDELSGELHGEAPTLEQLPRLPLLDRVVKESLRLFPPAPFTTRLTTKPTEVEGVPLPTGSEVVVSFYHTHRDPDVFADPTSFRPDRWERCDPSPWEYLPFGAGARQCIGAGFASLELRIVLPMLLQRFRPGLARARVDRETRIVLSPARGLPMVLHAPSSRPALVRAEGQVREMVRL